MKDLCLHMQITMPNTTGTFISLANKHLISSGVEIPIKRQGNISMVAEQRPKADAELP